MILYIFAGDDEKVKLVLRSKLKSVEHFFVSKFDLSEKLPLEIKKFLTKQKILFKNLKKIEVFRGPGHFSRIRTTVAIANALNFVLDESSVKNLVIPIYNKPPNITKSKKKLYGV